MTEPRPLRRDEVRSRIVATIVNQAIKAGDKLHSERQFAELFAVNHLTVRVALAELEAAGIVTRKVGSGTFYTGKKIALKATRRDHNAAKRTVKNLVTIVFHAEKHFYSDLLNQITTALQNDGYLITNFLLSGSELDDEAASLAALDRAFATAPDIMLALQGAVNKTAALAEKFNAGCANISRVIRLIGNDAGEIPLRGQLVTIDHLGAMRDAIQRLKKNGHTRIAYLGGALRRDYLPSAQNRRYAAIYAQAMIEEGLASEIKIVCPEEGNEASVRATIAEFLARSAPQRASAVLAIHDYLGAITIDMARDLGLQVPRDLSVIGYYDTPWSEHYKMDSIRFPNAAIVTRVSELLKQAEVKDGATIFPAEYVVRETTGAAP
jgi:DNA-binding LacI/PurR family transcriptional regulator